MIMEKHGNNTHENAGGSLALWQSKSREGIDIAPKVVTMAIDYDKTSYRGLPERDTCATVKAVSRVTASECSFPYS